MSRVGCLFGDGRTLQTHRSPPTHLLMIQRHLLRPTKSSKSPLLLLPSNVSLPLLSRPLKSPRLTPPQQQCPAPDVPAPSPEAETKSERPSLSGKVVSGNVALSRRGASVTGPYKGGESLLDGRSEGYAKAKLYFPVVVTLPEVYLLRSVRIHLIAAWLPNNSRESFYQYKVEVSEDGVNYETVADRTSGRHRDWQDITFPPRPVQFIRIIGTHDHPHQTGIRIAEVEAFCPPP
jgi:hypothetical protein